MLVTDPSQRASLQEVLSHHWMVKTYEGPPTNYLPRRVPLELPLDPEVIKGMQGFEFGTAEEIESKLRSVIESPEYQNAVASGSEYHDTNGSIPNPEKRKFSFDFYKRRSHPLVGTPESRKSSEILNADPLNAYHPYISIYYLVSEKLRRTLLNPDDNHIGASPREDSLIRAVVGETQISRPEQAYTGREKNDVSVTVGELRSRSNTFTLGESTKNEPIRAAETGRFIRSPKPAEKKESLAGGLFRRFSTRLSKEHRELPAPPKDRTSDIRQNQIKRTESTSATISKVPTHERLLDDVKGSGNLALHDESLKQPSEIPHDTLNLQRSSSHTRHESADLETSSDVAKASVFDSGPSATRAKSLSYAAKPTKATAEARTPPKTVLEEEEALETLGAAEGIKPVFLKGLFSVSTTSTKPLTQVRKDIASVLDRLQIVYQPLPNGFACSHQPSIDLRSIVDRDAVSADKLQHKRGLSFGSGRRPSRQETVASGSDISFDTLAKQSKGEISGLGSSMIVKFEIQVVRVPLLGLSGVQFKRMSGNTWQYKSLASKILAELHL